MHAAMQHNTGTMQSAHRPLPAQWPHLAGHRAVPMPMTQAKPRQYHIQGLTHEGRAFRPSDWAERLAGAMSSFRPGGQTGGIGAFIGYSPYCVPQQVDGVRCVLVSEALRGIEPMAWDFVMNFARDNHLIVAEVRVPPEPPK